jgi:polyphosphate kinase 2
MTDATIPTSISEMEHDRPYPERLKRGPYERDLHDLQVELLKAQQWVKDEGERVVILFEGRDAAGKGGAIKRFTEHLSPRGGRVVALTAPNDAERTQWYFQRYIAHLPTAGEIVLFDRSWYNRAGVERVMDFCTPRQLAQFLRQVPDLEASLVDSGIRLFKLWFTVSQAEQHRRFEERRTDPLRQWKLSPIDEASIDRFDDYTEARNQMLLATDTGPAPWTLVNSNDKRRARLESIRAVLHELPYAHKHGKVAHAPDPHVVRPAASVALLEEHTH